MPWQFVTSLQYGRTFCNTPSLSGSVQRRTGPFSCETSSRPLSSKVMLTSEKTSFGSGFFAAISTRKPSGTVKRGLPAAATWFHGAVLPYRPSAFAGFHDASSKSSFCQSLPAVFDAFHEPSLHSASFDWPLGV